MGEDVVRVEPGRVLRLEFVQPGLGVVFRGDYLVCGWDVYEAQAGQSASIRLGLCPPKDTAEPGPVPDGLDITPPGWAALSPAERDAIRAWHARGWGAWREPEAEAEAPPVEDGPGGMRRICEVVSPAEDDAIEARFAGGKPAESWRDRPPLL